VGLDVVLLWGKKSPDLKMVFVELGNGSKRVREKMGFAEFGRFYARVQLERVA
jgi:hypothetical protein